VPGFVGGSAWKMAQDIGGGYLTLNSTSLKQYRLEDMRQLVGELEKRQRELRAEQIPVDDVDQIKARNRQLMRLSQAMMIIRTFAQRRFRVSI
jgi:hypothetical protein